MSLCFFLFRVSLFPRFKLIPQISMCSREWPGRLKCLATGLDRSDPLLFTSSKFSARFSNVIMYSLLQRVQVMQLMILEIAVEMVIYLGVKPITHWSIYVLDYFVSWII